MATRSTDDLAAAFAEITRAIAACDDVDALLDRLSRAAVLTLDGCSDASVTVLGDDGRPMTQATSSPRALEVDHHQYALDEGPCLSAMRGDLAVYVPDLQGDDRWPQLAAATPETPLRSVLSLRLAPPDDQEVLGSLNLYGDQPDAFDEPTQHLALVFATQAAVTLVAARSTLRFQENEVGLRDALASRDVIGQAKGILMERYKVTAEEAFGILRRASQQLNVKLRAVATELAETGVLRGGD